MYYFGNVLRSSVKGVSPRLATQNTYFVKLKPKPSQRPKVMLMYLLQLVTLLLPHNHKTHNLKTLLQNGQENNGTRSTIGRKKTTGTKTTNGKKTTIGKMTATGMKTNGMKTNGMTKIGKQMDGTKNPGISLMTNMNTNSSSRQTSTAATRHKSTI